MNPTDPDSEDNEQQEPKASPVASGIHLCAMPVRYPFEEALEEAHCPQDITLPQDQALATPDPWDEPPRIQSPATDQQETATNKEPKPKRQGAKSKETNGTTGASGQPGAGNRLDTKEGNREPEAIGAQVVAADASASLVARAGTVPEALVTEADAPPETIQETLAGLPKWQAHYVLALMEYGGIPALAAAKTNVSVASVEKYQKLNPAFAAACQRAVNHSTDLIEAHTFRGATVGDLRPKYDKGVIVGYYRVRDTKAAELMLKVRGRLSDGTEKQQGATVAVQIVTKDAVATVATDALERIYRARAASSQ